MAATNTTLTGTQFAAHGIALTAATVDTVTFPAYRSTVRVLNHTGSSAIYFTTDGSTPTVGGASTYVVPPVAGAEVTRPTPQVSGGTVAAGAPAATVVKLISAGTPTYSVVGL